jgi:glycine/serine hydroxymethyltransferase
MRKVAGLIAETLSNIGDAETVERVRKGVRDLTDTFPLYAWKRAGVAVG